MVKRNYKNAKQEGVNSQNSLVENPRTQKSNENEETISLITEEISDNLETSQKETVIKINEIIPTKQHYTGSKGSKASTNSKTYNKPTNIQAKASLKTAGTTKDGSNKKCLVQTQRSNFNPNETGTNNERPIDSIRRKKSSWKSAAQTNIELAYAAKDILMNLLYSVIKIRFESTPSRCFAIVAHCRLMPFFLFATFILICSAYYGGEPIRCIDQHDRSLASAVELNHCIQSPYKVKSKHWRTHENKIYALYYKWTHWGLLLLGILYKIVALACYVLEDKRLRKFLKELQDTNDYIERANIVQNYFSANFLGHNFLFKVIILHFIAGTINVLSFLAVSWTFDYKYWHFPLYLLLKRDFVTFDDEYSLIFPPFVNCEISPKHHIRVGRTSYYGCHLALMEMYEKFFMILWFIQVFLLIFTIVSLLNWIGELFVRIEKKSTALPPAPRTNCFPCNERIVLELVRPLLFGDHYREIVQDLSTWNPAAEKLKFNCTYKILCPDVLENHSKVDAEGIELEEITSTLMPNLQQISHGIPLGIVPTGNLKSSLLTKWLR